MGKTKPKILYVEDDLSLSYVTKDNLELRGYDITFCKDGREALNTFHNGVFNLCVLDVMMPEMDGFALAKAIRETDRDIPIIFLSAKSLKEDRIEGLTIGGDDYITKPFSIDELVLKIEVFLKRSAVVNSNFDKKDYQIGKYRLDAANLILRYDTKEQRLTSRESELLKYLAKNANNIVKKEEILNSVWGNDSYYNSRSLDVFISRLRKYLSMDPNIKINNIHGIGFILLIQE